MVAEQRRLEQQALRREKRRQTSVKTGAAARETLINRLRSQIGAASATEIVSSVDSDLAVKRRSAVTAALPSPPDQPPAKYRRITRQQSANFGAEAAGNRISDIEMMDVERTTPSSTKSISIPDEEERRFTNTDTAKESELDASEEAIAQTGPEIGQKRGFLELLNDNIAKRREARLSGEFSPIQALSGSPATKRRRQGSASPSLVKRLQGGSSIRQAQHAQQQDVDPRVPTWEAPVSPYGLLEEELFTDPWKLLVACMLLNKTTGGQVRKVIWDLFALCPTPAAAAVADPAAIEGIIKPLGLFRKRAVMVQRMSDEYVNKEWKDPSELHGIGQYAADAYYIFCRGLWKEVEPQDKDLKRYKEWLASTGGLGTGLTRHVTGGTEVKSDVTS